MFNISNYYSFTISVVHHSYRGASGGRHQVLGTGERHIGHAVGLVRQPRSQEAYRGRHDGLGQGRRSQIVRTGTYIVL